MAAQQIIVKVGVSGNLVGELPGSNGARMKLDLVERKADYTETIAEAINTLKAFSEFAAVSAELSEAISKAKAKDANNDKAITHAKILESQVETMRLRMGAVENVISNLNHILKKDETLIGHLSRILQPKDNNLDENGLPTQQLLRHWERHEIWGDPLCPFCLSEGKCGRPQREKRGQVTRFDAIPLGLKARGYDEKTDGLFTKANHPPVKVHGLKVSDEKRGLWAKSHIEALILDGEIEAKRIGFKSEAIFAKQRSKVLMKRDGVVVKTIVKPSAKKPAGQRLPRKVPVIDLKL